MPRTTIPPFVRPHEDAPLTHVVFRNELPQALGVSYIYVKELLSVKGSSYHPGLRLPGPRWKMPGGTEIWHRDDLEEWSRDVHRRNPYMQIGWPVLRFPGDSWKKAKKIR